MAKNVNTDPIAIAYEEGMVNSEGNTVIPTIAMLTKVAKDWKSNEKLGGYRLKRLLSVACKPIVSDIDSKLDELTSNGNRIQVVRGSSLYEMTGRDDAKAHSFKYAKVFEELKANAAIYLTPAGQVWFNAKLAELERAITLVQGLTVHKKFTNRYNSNK